MARVLAKRVQAQVRYFSALREGDFFLKVGAIPDYTDDQCRERLL